MLRSMRAGGGAGSSSGISTGGPGSSNSSGGAGGGSGSSGSSAGRPAGSGPTQSPDTVVLTLDDIASTALPQFHKLLTEALAAAAQALGVCEAADGSLTTTSAAFRVKLMQQEVPQIIRVLKAVLGDPQFQCRHGDTFGYDSFKDEVILDDLLAAMNRSPAAAEYVKHKAGDLDTARAQAGKVAVAAIHALCTSLLAAVVTAQPAAPPPQQQQTPSEAGTRAAEPQPTDQSPILVFKTIRLYAARVMKLLHAHGLGSCNLPGQVLQHSFEQNVILPAMATFLLLPTPLAAEEAAAQPLPPQQEQQVEQPQAQQQPDLTDLQLSPKQQHELQCIAAGLVPLIKVATAESPATALEGVQQEVNAGLKQAAAGSKLTEGEALQQAGSLLKEVQYLHMLRSAALDHQQLTLVVKTSTCGVTSYCNQYGDLALVGAVMHGLALVLCNQSASGDMLSRSIDASGSAPATCTAATPASSQTG